MPGYDQAGPWGQGPRTGGGFGSCRAPAQEAEADVRTDGRGFGRGGRGLQRGFRRGFCFFGRGRGGSGYGARWVSEATPPNRTKPSLEAEAEGLRRRLDALEQRLASMEASGAGTKPA